MRKIILFIIVLIFIGGRVNAQPGLSYVYIQGDKATPFYVKLNGVMQQRYGKNYCIIPKLQAGKVEIEILYQQNRFSPQTYTFDVPENGYRSFLLNKQDTSYALYDINTRNYLYPVKK